MTLEATFARIAIALETLAANSGVDPTQPWAPPPDTGFDAPITPGIEPPITPGIEPPTDAGAQALAEANKAARARKPKPDTVVEPKPTPEYKDVQAAATTFSQVGNRDGVLAIFAVFDIKTLKDLKPADFQRAIDAFDSATAALAGAA